MNPFKTDGALSPEDRKYLEEMEKAKERQMAAARARAPYVDPMDEDRKRASEENMRRVREANGAHPFSADLGPVPVPRPVPTPASFVSIMKAEPFVEDGVSLPQSKEKYAPNWPSMKQLIAKSDGVWVVRRYEFQSLVPHILGFFGKEGWDFPDKAQKEEFEVIVKHGRVFRTDPE